MALTRVGFSDILADWLAETPIPPADAAGYGSDLYCTDDLRETGQMVEGLNTVAQNLFRRITTDRGSLLGAPNYGLDVRSFLNKGLDRTTVLAIPALVELELRKDVRVQTCSVTTLSSGTDYINLQVTTEAIAETGDVGQFDFTVNVTKAGVELAGLEFKS